MLVRIGKVLLTGVAALTAALVAGYVAVGLVPFMAWGATSAAVIAAFFVWRGTGDGQGHVGTWRIRPIDAAVIAIDMLLLALLFHFRTGAAIVSPWDVLPVSVFLLFGISSFLLAVALLSGSQMPLAPTMVHLGVHWGTALIVYRHGFGYDPFVHQATERFIAAYGRIEPVQPFYLGQHVLVAWLAKMLHLSVAWVDRLLVPVSAIAVLPAVLFFSAAKDGDDDRLLSGVMLLALFLLPIPFFTFTIPFHLALLAFLVEAFILFFSESPSRWVLFALAMIAAFSHPLIGIPALLLCASSCFLNRPQAQFFMLSLGIPAALLLAFFLYGHDARAAMWLPSVSSFGIAAKAIFGRGDDAAFAPFGYRVLYGLASVWPLFFTGLGAAGMVLWKEKRKKVGMVFGAASGLVLGAFLIAATVRVSNIISSEQFEFALRLVKIVPLLFLPGIGYLFAEWMRSSDGSVPMRRVIVAGVCCSVVAVGSWFFTYPQHNAAMNRYAAGVGDEDYAIVRTIEEMAKGETYAVLSPQMTAAAALDTFGFERHLATIAGDRYPYAIPTGGELYSFYLRLYQSADLHETMRQLFSFTRAQKVFIVVPTAWDPDGRVQNEMASLGGTTPYISPAVRVFGFTAAAFPSLPAAR